MRDATYFTKPKFEWQRRYEALRASLVERLPHKIVADRYGYKLSYVRLLRHMFKKGKIDFSEPVPEGRASKRRLSGDVRRKIREWREKRLSAGEITELLNEDGEEISVRTVERVLAEEGFPKLPRRTRLKIGMTVKGAEIPKKSAVIHVSDLDGQRFSSPSAGVFIFAPFLRQLDIAKVVQAAGLPGTKVIPAMNYLLSFLAFKLLGTERYAHAGDHAFDPALGIFAGLNVLPKCTAMSTYSYSMSEDQVQKFQQAFIKQADSQGLYDGSIINLDFHSAPHFGDESVLERHWAGARNKTMKSALVLFAQDAASKLMLYANSDIMRDEADEQVLKFLSFWKGVRRNVQPTLIFDSRFTSYEKLSQLNHPGRVKFITLRRRGKNLIRQTSQMKEWKRINIPHEKRKYPNPQVHESHIKLREYKGTLRQIIVRGNGHEKPAFLITNDFETPVELVVGNYARRWRVENGIAEAVKFFHLNALSSPILVKIHFDIAMTMVADTLYTMLASKLRGFEACDAPKIFRHFIRGKGVVDVQGNSVSVSYPKRAHNPILRQIPWHNLPMRLPGLGGPKLELHFG